jgi:hypothetical protein
VRLPNAALRLIVGSNVQLPQHSHLDAQLTSNSLSRNIDPIPPQQRLSPAMSTPVDHQEAMTDDSRNESRQSPQQPAAQTYRQIAAAHIAQLSAINAQLPKMLAYFAACISQLSNNPMETSVQTEQEDSVKKRQNVMWTMSLYVGAAIKEIREELEAQINDLWRYGVIPAQHQRYTALPHAGQVIKFDPEASVKNGGYGDFDVGVLNARAASGQVGGEEVLDRLKAMMEELMHKSGVDMGGEDMVVDG